MSGAGGTGWSRIVLAVKPTSWNAALKGLRPSFYSQGMAEQIGTRVEIDAPFATGPIVNAIE